MPPTHNPRRGGPRPVYRLRVDLGLDLGLADAVRDLVAEADLGRPVVCPSCGSPLVSPYSGGKRIPGGGLVCGACGAAWAAEADARALASAWRHRAAVAAVAARAALPRAVASGEALAPRADDLVGWARVGLADALLGRPPAYVGGPPWASAYAHGWAHATARLCATSSSSSSSSTADQPEPDQPEPGRPMDPINPTPDTPIHPTPIPPAVAAALVRAQARAETVARDSKNLQIGYRYSTADAIAATAREVLTAEGLAFARLRVVPVAERTLAETEIGAQSYVGDVEITWALIHTSGAALVETSRIAVICSKARPQDKATAASVTYATGQILLGLLCLDREDREHGVDSRAEGGPSPRRAPRAEPAERRQAPPADAPDERVVADVRALVDEIVELSAASPADVWFEALDACKVPRTRKGESVDRPERLTRAEAPNVRRNLAHVRDVLVEGVEIDRALVNRDNADDTRRELDEADDPGAQ